MKHTLLPLLVLLLTTLPAAADTVDVSAITGEYICDIYVTIAEPIDDESIPLTDYTVTLTAGSEEGTITFAIYDLYIEAFGGSLGDIVLEDVGVVDEGNDKYTFAENDIVRLQLLSGAIDADVNIDHETSYVEGDYIYVDVNVDWVLDSGNIPIYVRVIGYLSEDESEETGIAAITTTAQASDAPVYNLQGMKVGTTSSSKSLPAGIYIVNGKKISIK